MSLLPVSFFVPGQPKGQPRARACVRGKHAGVYDPGTADAWKAQVAAAALAAFSIAPVTRKALIDEACFVDIWFYFPRPKGHCRVVAGVTTLRPDAPAWHVSKPDRDNLDKAVLDALVQWHILSDDALVCGGEIRKGYCPTYLTAVSVGAHITIRRPPTP